MTWVEAIQQAAPYILGFSVWYAIGALVAGYYYSTYVEPDERFGPVWSWPMAFFVALFGLLIIYGIEGRTK